MLRLVGSNDPEVQIAAACTIRNIRKLALTAEKLHFKEMYVFLLFQLLYIYICMYYLINFTVIKLQKYTRRNRLSFVTYQRCEYCTKTKCSFKEYEIKDIIFIEST